MSERPPTLPETPEAAALRALLSATDDALAVQRRISEALKRARPEDEEDMRRLEALFAEARAAAEREAEALRVWKSVRTTTER